MGHLSDIAWGVGAFAASWLLWRLGQDMRERIKAKWFPDPDPPATYRDALDAPPGEKHDG